MKGVYWKPQRATRIQRAVIAVVALLGLAAVERFPSVEQQPYYEDKLRAAKKANEALNVLRSESMRKKIPLLPQTDPGLTGMIGLPLSPITSGSGALISKQSSVNPNFAAVVVQWLRELDLKAGDHVAVGVSGSFPAMNTNVYAALHELDLEPVIIISTAASQYGANEPTFTWPDMEAVLRKENVFPYKALAASRGGVGDEGIGLTRKGQRLLDRAIERNELPKLEATDEEDRVQQRIRLFREAAGDEPIKAYINVGGGTVSVGTRVGKRAFHPGVNTRLPRNMQDIPSVMGGFVEQGVPALHLTKIVYLAEEYGLPVGPVLLEPGKGEIFEKSQPNRWLAAAVLIALLLAWVAAARTPWSARLLSTQRIPAGPPTRSASGTTGGAPSTKATASASASTSTSTSTSVTDEPSAKHDPPSA